MLDLFLGDLLLLTLLLAPPAAGAAFGAAWGTAGAEMGRRFPRAFLFGLATGGGLALLQALAMMLVWPIGFLSPLSLWAGQWPQWSPGMRSMWSALTFIEGLAILAALIVALAIGSYRRAIPFRLPPQPDAASNPPRWRFSLARLLLVQLVIGGLAAGWLTLRFRAIDHYRRRTEVERRWRPFHVTLRFDRNGRVRALRAPAPGKEGTAQAVTDADIPALLAMPMLNTLDLSGSQLTDRGLERLAAAHRLRTLDISRTAITDRGLQALRTSPSRLRTLLAAGTQLTDASVDTLIAISRSGTTPSGALRVYPFSIDIRDTQISPAGRKRLTEAPGFRLLQRRAASAP